MRWKMLTLAALLMAAPAVYAQQATTLTVTAWPIAVARWTFTVLFV